MFLCVIAGNFGYQWFHGCDWNSAIERSYFMGMAVAMCALFVGSGP